MDYGSVIKVGIFWAKSSGGFSLGENVTVKMIRDKLSGAGAGYCFVDFGSNASAMRQLTTVQGSVIPGTNRVFKLNWASGGGLVDKTNQTGPEFSVFVGDLGQEVNDLLLFTTFQSRYDSCKSAKVVTDPMTGMSRGYGFVRFGSEIDQQRAMNEMQGQYCGSRPMRIAVATPKNKMNAVGGAAGSVGGAQMGGMMGGMGMNMGMMGMGMPAGGVPHHQQHQQMVGVNVGGAAGYYGMPMQGMGMPPQMQAAGGQLQGAGAAGAAAGYGMQQAGAYGAQFPDPNNTTVFIGGLSPNVGEDELRSYFNQFGEIVYTKIPPGKGCGFVQYSHRQSAEMAIQQMNNAMIGGSRVRLSWGKSQAAMKGPAYIGIMTQDPIKADPVDRLNDNFIGQKEDSLERNDVGATGWRSGQQQVYA
ncbi:hypothetical protein HDU76_006409, partial [Blyttiomyces sp. JEL0837]